MKKNKNNLSKILLSVFVLSFYLVMATGSDDSTPAPSDPKEEEPIDTISIPEVVEEEEEPAPEINNDDIVSEEEITEDEEAVIVNSEEIDVE